MTPTKRYAIRCSTEEQARECIGKGYTVVGTKFAEEYYKKEGYISMSYSEAKELGLLGEHYQDTINKLSIDSEKETTEQQSDVVTISLTKDEACICLKGLGRLENETSPLEGEEKELYDKLSKFTD